MPRVNTGTLLPKLKQPSNKPLLSHLSRGLSPWVVSKPTVMRYGQEVELYFFIVSIIAPEVISFLHFQCQYDGVILEYALHYEPCKANRKRHI